MKHSLFACFIIAAMLVLTLAPASAASAPAAYVKAFRQAQGLFDFASEANMPLHTWDLNAGEWAIAIKPARYPATVAFYEYEQPLTPNADGSYTVNPDDALETVDLVDNAAYVICPGEYNSPNLLISVADSSGFYTWRPQIVDGALKTNANFVPMTMDNAYGKPRGPPPILCRASPVETREELDALAKRYGVEVIGKFAPQATDKWFLLPQATPLFVKLYKVEVMGGDMWPGGMFEDHTIEANQAFVYCGQWKEPNPETDDMDPQYVIGVAKEYLGKVQYMWRLPESDNDPWCPGFAPLHQ